MAVRARSMGAVGGNRGRRPMNKEEEVERDGWRWAAFQCSSSLRAALPDSAGRQPSEIPSADSGQFPLSFPADSRWVPALPMTSLCPLPIAWRGQRERGLAHRARGRGVYPVAKIIVIGSVANKFCLVLGAGFYRHNPLKR